MKKKIMWIEQRWCKFVILLVVSTFWCGKIKAFCPNTRHLRPSTNLNGVLSSSQIVSASNPKRNPTLTTPTQDSIDYFRKVLEEITLRQERILDALERELQKKDTQGEESEDPLKYDKTVIKRIKKIAQRQAEISNTITEVQQIEKQLKRNTPFRSVREAIVKLGFESILNEAVDDWITQKAIQHEFGRPKGFDGLIFYTPLGVPILVGTQGSHSDETLRQVSQGMDLWFQVEGYSGSRVLLRTSLKRNLKGSKCCNQMAADLAAYYSDFRWETDVPIMYTDSRHVAKRGSKSGQMRKRKSFGCIVGHPATVSDVADGKEP